MIRGLYTAAAGMLTGLLRHESIVHNLSNVRTVGYKADRATTTDFPSLLLTQVQAGQGGPEVGRLGTGVSLSTITTDYGDGPLKLTDHPLDFAVAGNGFFRLETPNGVRLTRDGRFHRDVDGHLINARGYRVLGANGPIQLPVGELTVSPRGQIFVNDEPLTQLSLAAVEDTATLVKDGETMFALREGEPALLAAEETQIYQGYIEDSNVDVAQAVTEMTSVLRAYQASQRLVQFQDQINSKSVTELGRV
jgi:flagellar basal-body rod protein FlgG